MIQFHGKRGKKNRIALAIVVFTIVAVMVLGVVIGALGTIM